MLAGNASRESPHGWSGGRDATAGLLGDRTVLVLKEGLGWTGLGGGLSKPGDSHAHQEGEPSQECSPSRPRPRRNATGPAPPAAARPSVSTVKRTDEAFS